MPHNLPSLGIPDSAQRARIARRKMRRTPDAAVHLRHSVADHLQHAINTQMNGIVGMLEMLQQTDLTADQRTMLDVVQGTAENLLDESARLLRWNINDPTDGTAHPADSFPPSRMLLIDPDAASRSAIEQAFGTQNIPIDVFETATAALNAMTAAAHAGDPYRIALLDQNLQALDGETLGQAISADPVHRDTLLVLISGTHTAQDVHRLTQAGFSAWLPAAPPVSMLFDTVGTLCNWIADKDVPRFISAGVTTDDQSATPDFLPFDGYRILAIDDNPVNLQVVERMLARMGCSVDTASGGESAIAMFSHANYDLVLVDCQMPGLDGYQTTALLRSQEDDNRHTPIIGWSARSGRKERDTCLAIGMDDFIAKPLRLQTLNALLAKWLSPVRSKAAPADVRPDDELDATRQMFGEDFAELAELFLTDTPLRIASLKKAKGDSDAAACAKLAHALCGSCASIGATALAAICRDLEIRARSGAIGDSSRIDALENEYARIHGRLQCMMHEGSIDAPRTRRDHHQ